MAGFGEQSRNGAACPACAYDSYLLVVDADNVLLVCFLLLLTMMNSAIGAPFDRLRTNEFCV
jgi:hypothetical protein